MAPATADNKETSARKQKAWRAPRTWRVPQQRLQGPHVPGRRVNYSANWPDRPDEESSTHAEERPKGTDGQDGQAEAAENVEETEGSVDKTKLVALARQRLRYLQDAYTIGKAVEAMLKKEGKFDEALQLTRMASKDHKVVVSWNRLIDYQMRQQRLTGAMKLFNEMKKRAQLPNAQTYTTIFRGCAASQHANQAVFQATRLYHAMLASERIKPNTMHMNAVLTVCSRAKDIDSLFSIVNTADQHTRRPDNLTYTIVLNGLRYATVQPGQQPDIKSADGDDEVHVDKESVTTTIGRARAVWEEVIKNWRQGLVVLDEELVCAMGRVLRMGSREDNNDILSLVQQTMGIQRPDRLAVPAVDAPKGQGEVEQNRQPGSKTTSDMEVRTVAAMATEPEIATAATSVQLPVRISQFDPPPGIAALSVQRDSRRTVYVRPGANTLSLILMSISSTRKTSLAASYWNILTGHPYNVVPDSENWYQLLRTLRRGHASSKMVELIAQMPSEYMNHTTFQLAMATCAADNLNEHAFSNAGKVLDLMSKTLLEPDAMAMRLYLQTALTSNRRYRDTLRQEADNPLAREKAKLAFGRQLVRALTRLWDPLRLASNAVGFSANWPTPVASAQDDESGSNEKAIYNKKRELAAVARMMVSAADMVVTEVMADEATIKDLRISRNLLNRQIGRFYERREDAEPNLHAGRKRQEGARRTRKERVE
ncbi:hypothetical protein SEPCBS119000_002199 [Sporothrix epigloea]|uniref:Pentatricopeptide repeat protein n=1 Tax=Sporothrix epigloea TaxID=1892477 RepID=A0ABP0DEW0_9PEZI